MIFRHFGCCACIVTCNCDFIVLETVRLHREKQRLKISDVDEREHLIDPSASALSILVSVGTRAICVGVDVLSVA